MKPVHSDYLWATKIERWPLYRGHNPIHKALYWDIFKALLGHDQVVVVESPDSLRQVSLYNSRWEKNTMQVDHFSLTLNTIPARPLLSHLEHYPCKRVGGSSKYSLQSLNGVSHALEEREPRRLPN